MQVQFFPSKAGLSQLITDLLAVREAWLEVERAEKPSAATVAPTVPYAAAGPEDAPARMDWKG